jgi:hypothetical protein
MEGTSKVAEWDELSPKIKIMPGQKLIGKLDKKTYMALPSGGSLEQGELYLVVPAPDNGGIPDTKNGTWFSYRSLFDFFYVTTGFVDPPKAPDSGLVLRPHLDGTKEVGINLSKENPMAGFKPWPKLHDNLAEVKYGKGEFASAPQPIDAKAPEDVRVGKNGGNPIKSYDFKSYLSGIPDRLPDPLPNPWPKYPEAWGDYRKYPCPFQEGDFIKDQRGSTFKVTESRTLGILCQNVATKETGYISMSNYGKYTHTPPPVCCHETPNPSPVPPETGKFFTLPFETAVEVAMGLMRNEKVRDEVYQRILDEEGIRP